VITTIMPPADMRISVDYRVIMMHVWTVRCWKIYTVFSRGEKMLSAVQKVQY